MMILRIQETCGFLKGALATNQYEETPQAPLIWRRALRYHFTESFPSEDFK
jgi:hypothetical protein